MLSLTYQSCPIHPHNPLPFPPSCSISPYFLHSLEPLIHPSPSFLLNFSLFLALFRTPKYLKAAASEFFRPGEDEEHRSTAKREVSGVELVGDTSESVEPILDAFGFIAGESARLMYMPFWVFLMIEFRAQNGIASLYGIKQTNLPIYLYFNVVMIFFRPIGDVFNLSQVRNVTHTDDR